MNKMLYGVFSKILKPSKKTEAELAEQKNIRNAEQEAALRLAHDLAEIEMRVEHAKQDILSKQQRKSF